MEKSWSSQEEYLKEITLVTADDKYRLTPPSLGLGIFNKNNLVSEAKRWAYVLRNRTRWKNDKRAVEKHEQDAIETLRAFGLDDAKMQKLGTAREVMVELPYEQESLGWAGRIFPWEFILTIATKRYRSDGNRLIVFRYLNISPPPASWIRVTEFNILFVQSQPDIISAVYEIDSEAELVRKAFRLDENSSNFRVLKTPTLQELEQEVASYKPQIIHFAGCDNHQGVRLIRDSGGFQSLIWKRGPDNLEAVAASKFFDRSDAVVDGILLRHDDGKARITSAIDLASAVTVGGHRPYLVCMNTWNSAARIAPMMLAAGAIAAVGFQDFFNDSLGEYFYDVLYQKLSYPWNAPNAFKLALEDLLSQPDLGIGTGLVLWAAAPTIEPAAETVPEPKSAVMPVTPPAPAFPTAPAAAADAETDRNSDAPGSEQIICRIKPKRELNYSVLHNQGNLFEQFELHSSHHASKLKVEVVVELHCGSEKARYSSVQTIEGKRLPMVEKIRIPLTSGLIRSVSEAIQSSLFVEIMHDGKPVFRDTFPLRLLPVDQWLDNQKSGKWLPSFILPRDPAVEGAITLAQRYLRVISDDPTAGFDGYQSANTSDPVTLDQVDLQVEAIWATLLHEWNLGYINPPPTYADTSEGVLQLDSQRLRTPSGVKRVGMGTCIDLALLFAACLELVDIYPVIFLLDGHALPGYWRHHDFQVQYRDVRTPDDVESIVSSAQDVEGALDELTVPWRVLSSGYKELRKEIRAGRLVPLETVRLTEHGSFREAMLAGIDALSYEADFDSVLDIVTARHPYNVTPLPMLEEQI